ncbi:hypothetical protein QR680_003854 [Steinernema hermaphroditum]|uniref:Tyrosine-protein phosphatase domain-containing protein n=1 Tax=Steinernema hermaphroditum TaxID=289476 RepID=A0AA39HLS7_9BILA|nr:hypothetical protein QR680_003854 [Steinernema hermaphroditum]
MSRRRTRTENLTPNRDKLKKTGPKKNAIFTKKPKEIRTIVTDDPPPPPGEPNFSETQPESSHAELKMIDLQPNERTKIVMRRFIQATMARGVQKILQEYQELKSLENTAKMKSEVCAKNPDKNRYKDMVCLDKTRVVLRWPPGNKSDYIHANWVRGLPETPKDFICTQGPTAATRDDFWRMVWQEKCAVIIMLCSVVEEGKIKCDQYWPAKVGEKIGNDMVYTQLNVTSSVRDGGKQEHTLNHVQWTGWPDKGVPTTSTGALKLIIRTQHLQPAIVHCSAGVGRTGTVVALESCIRVLDTGNELSIYNVVRLLRAKRFNGCQTDLQYLYLHRAVLAFILSKNVVTADEIASFIYEYDAVLEQRANAKTPEGGTPVKTSPLPKK